MPSKTADESGGSGRPREPLFTTPFLLVSASNFLQSIGFSLFLHIPGFLQELGAGPVVIGWIFSTMAVVAIAIRPLLGRIMDSRGRRGLILLGHALNILAIGLYFFVDDIGPAIYAIRILHGVAEATLFTVLFTFGADHVPADRLTEGLAIFGVSGMLPMSIGGVLGDWILDASGYPMLFGVAWGLSVAALVVALPLRDRPPSRPADGEAEPLAARGFTAPLRQRDLLPVWWVSMIFFTGLASIFIFLKTYVMSRGVGSVGGFFTVYTGVALVLRVTLGWLPDRVGATRVLVPALVSLATGLVLLAFAETTSMVLWAGALCGIGHAYVFPIQFSLVVSRARESERGSAVAIYTGFSDLGMVIGGPLFGAVLDRMGYTTMYALVAAILVSGVAIFLPWNAAVVPRR